MVTKKIRKTHKKQIRSHGLRYRAEQNKRFYIRDTVSLKNFRLRVLDKKYAGPYIIVKIGENDCTTESLESRKRKVVHANNLRRFVVGTVANRLSRDSEGVLSFDSDGPTIELISWCAEARLEPRGIGNKAGRLNLRYNLRQNGRQPDRYRVPILD